MKNVRVGFKKVGLAKYISHLDLMRCMSRSIKRANIPVWYTEGFNQHLFVSFALPLSLGTESLCECMEMKILDDELDFNDVKDRLNKELPEGLIVTEIWELVKKAAEIEKSDYIVTLSQSNHLLEDFNALNEFIAQDEILVEKKTKKGMSTVDLKPLIFNFNSKMEDDKIIIDFKLPAGVIKNINPSLILDNYFASCNVKCKVDILRTAVYDKQGEIFR